MELRAYPDREMLAMALADALASSLRKCLEAHDTASLCVPGGSSPGETFALLSGAEIEWPRVHVLLGDERWVPETSDRSNTALLKRTLLTGRAARAVHVPMVTDDPTPEAGIPALTTGLGGVLPLSVLLLGMGEDMHTASLFPDAEGLAAAMAPDAPPVAAIRAPDQPEPRVTLTRPVLEGAMETHILIMGEAKRATIERARRHDPIDAPVAAFLGGAIVHWAP
jgi:6-phosphogluconolactonase